MVGDDGSLGHESGAIHFGAVLGTDHASAVGMIVDSFRRKVLIRNKTYDGRRTVHRLVRQFILHVQLHQ